MCVQMWENNHEMLSNSKELLDSKVWGPLFEKLIHEKKGKIRYYPYNNLITYQDKELCKFVADWRQVSRELPSSSIFKNDFIHLSLLNKGCHSRSSIRPDATYSWRDSFLHTLHSPIMRSQRRGFWRASGTEKNSFTFKKCVFGNVWTASIFYAIISLFALPNMTRTRRQTCIWSLTVGKGILYEVNNFCVQLLWVLSS